MMHTCPGPKCPQAVREDMLACSAHWYQVPKPLRDAVWKAWQAGAGAGTAAHQAAMRAAIRTMTPIGAGR